MTTLRVAHLWDGRPAAADEVAEVRLARVAAGLQVDVAAPYHGDAAPSGEPGPCWQLWDFEVVELFIAGPDGRYLEVELGPHGHHLVLQLEGVRRVVASMLPLLYHATIDASAARASWHGRATIAEELLPPRPWTGNAYAIHGCGSGRRYLVHTPLGTARPDFHAVARFEALEVSNAS